MNSLKKQCYGGGKIFLVVTYFVLLPLQFVGLFIVQTPFLDIIPESVPKIRPKTNEDWTDYHHARNSLINMDLQTKVGAPLEKDYRELTHSTSKKLLFSRLNMAKPPARCQKFFTPDYPVDIDLALAQMIGTHPSIISPSDVQYGANQTFTRFRMKKNRRYVIHEDANFTETMTAYEIRNGVLYYDNRTVGPATCGFHDQIMGFIVPLARAHNIEQLPNIRFRWNCIDNPFPPYNGLWTYAGVTDRQHPLLVFPDVNYIQDRWNKVSKNANETKFEDKPKQAAYRGNFRTGYVPMVHLNYDGIVTEKNPNDLNFLQTTTSRFYFSKKYRNDTRINVSFKKMPMKQMLDENRVLFSIAGNSYASNSLESLLSNSIVAYQDFPTRSWEDHFFVAGIHYIALPRSLNDNVVQKVLDEVFNDANVEIFTNMSRLASTVAEIVANEKDFVACYAHRATSLWHSLMEKEQNDHEPDNDHNKHLVAVLDLTKDGMLDPLDLFQKATH